MVPVRGGEPQLLLKNASGLVWTGPRRVMFSEMKKGVRMGIVAAGRTARERAMFTCLRMTLLWRTVPICHPMGSGCSWRKWTVTTCGSLTFACSIEPFLPLLLRTFQRRVEEALHGLPAFLAHVRSILAPCHSCHTKQVVSRGRANPGPRGSRSLSGLLGKMMFNSEHLRLTRAASGLQPSCALEDVIGPPASRGH